MVLPWLPARKKNRIEPSPISHKSTSLASASQAPCPVVFQLVAACASNVCSDGRGLYLGTTSQQYRRARTSTYLHVLNVAAPPLTMSPRDSTMHDIRTLPVAHFMWCRLKQGSTLPTGCLRVLSQWHATYPTYSVQTFTSSWLACNVIPLVFDGIHVDKFADRSKYTERPPDMT